MEIYRGPWPMPASRCMFCGGSFAAQHTRTPSRLGILETYCSERSFNPLLVTTPASTSSTFRLLLWRARENKVRDIYCWFTRRYDKVRSQKGLWGTYSSKWQTEGNLAQHLAVCLLPHPHVLCLLLSRQIPRVIHGHEARSKTSSPDRGSQGGRYRNRCSR